MNASECIRQGYEFHLCQYLVGMSNNVPDGLQKRMRARAVAIVDRITPKDREPSLAQVSDLLTEEFSHGHAAESADKLTYRFDGELFRVPDGWADQCNRVKEIELVFGEACGGSTGAAFEMVEAMQASGARITGTVIGCALSAHALLWLGCDHRHMRPDSTLMIHGPIESVIGTPDMIRRALRSLEECQERHIDFITDRTGLDRAVVERWILEGDVTLSAAECAALGLAGFTGAVSS